MPAATQPNHVSDRAVRYKGGSGVIDNDPLIQTGDVSKFNLFMLMSTTGAMDVTVCLDGANFSVDPYSLQDMGAASSAPVLVTAANRIFAFRGTFERILVSQAGGVAVENACLMCSLI